MIDSVELADRPTLAKFRFQKTPIMSTYLLAFIVGEYDYIEATDSNGVLIRVYTALGKKELGRFALDVGKIFSINKYFVAYFKFYSIRYRFL